MHVYTELLLIQPATTAIYTLSLHDALPILLGLAWAYIAHTDSLFEPETLRRMVRAYQEVDPLTRSEEHTSELQSRGHLVCRLPPEKKKKPPPCDAAPM